jgi:hypothetical protein
LREDGERTGRPRVLWGLLWVNGTPAQQRSGQVLSGVCRREAWQDGKKKWVENGSMRQGSKTVQKCHQKCRLLRRRSLDTRDCRENTTCTVN